MDAPENRRLKDAMQAALEASGDELEPRLKAFLQLLVASTLITPEDEELAAVESDDEDLMLVLFTDVIELHFFEPGCRWTTVRAAEAIRQVAAGDYDGLVIDPGVRQFELSREDVEDFFDVDA